MVDKNIKPDKEEKPNLNEYCPKGDERKVYDQYLFRKNELLGTRSNVLGIDIDQRMKDWDNDYFNKVAKIPASELDPEQKPVAINNAFGKIQTALSLLVDRNPDFLLNERLSKYSANNEIMRALLKKSWQRTDSIYQLLLFIFNMAKRGWGVGRTYHKMLDMDGKFRKAVDGKEVWETERVVKIDDIAFKNLDNHNVWIDEEARPFDFFSVRDWMWREVIHIDKIKRMFPEKEFPNMKYVKVGGNVGETPDGTSQEEESSGQASQRREDKKGMTEVYFYENQFDDKFIVEINGVMVIYEPLPQHHKRLSLVTSFWNLRSAETIYGIGVIEEMERNENIIDRLLNMNMRQLLLSIAPAGFFNGIAGDFDNENFKIKAGVMKRIEGNPKDITFVKIPEPSDKSLKMIQFLEGKEDQDTGITDALAGNLENIPASAPAFSLGISREAGLKRLKLPLRSIQYGFNWEGKNRADLIKQVYSNFEVERVINPETIDEYIKEINEDPGFYFLKRDENGSFVTVKNPKAEESMFINKNEEGEASVFSRRFPEEQLTIEEDDKGNFIESEDKKFFKIRPEMLSWEGDVTFVIDSILVHSEELEKLDTTRFIELLTGLVQLPPEISEKWIKQATIAFNKDPKKWIPDNFLDIMNKAKQQEEGGVDLGQSQAQSEMPDVESQKGTITGRLKGLFSSQRTSSGTEI